MKLTVRDRIGAKLRMMLIHSTSDPELAAEELMVVVAALSEAINQPIDEEALERIDLLLGLEEAVDEYQKYADEVARFIAEDKKP